jgi:hypothetical protein
MISFNRQVHWPVRVDVQLRNAAARASEFRIAGKDPEPIMKSL